MMWFKRMLNVLMLLTVSSAYAADDELLFQLGGGVPISTGPGMGANTLTIGAGASWNADLTCGNFDIEASVTNQLNGITGYYQNLMSNVISAATGVIASLPALAIQRLNPALYDQLQNGILQASGEFGSAEFKCEEMVEKMSTVIAEDGWGGLAQGGWWSTESNTPNADIVESQYKVETDGVDNGVTWVDGNQAGGASQDPIVINKDVSIAGYNLLVGRPATDLSMVHASTCNGALLCTVWNRPEDASQWLVDVIGDKEIMTCQGCNKVDSVAGMGLHRKYEQEKGLVETSLNELVNRVLPINQTNLELVAGAQGISLSRPVIEAIREEQQAPIIVARLAGEMALSRVMEQALIARRLLLAGIKEPNIANNKIAAEEIQASLAELDGEIEAMMFELRVRELVATNTPRVLLRRERARGYVPVVEQPARQSLRDGAVQ